MIRIFKATVMSIDDPEQRGRITVACSGLMGDEETEMPFWIDPDLQWGWFVIPDVGETVNIIADNDPSRDEIFGQSTIDSLKLSWDGTRQWTDEETEDQIESRPIPEVFKTNYGKRRGFVTPAGHMLLFDDTEGKEKIEISWDQIKIVLNEEKIEISTSGNVEINANTVDVKGGTVNLLDGADEKVIRGDSFKTTFDNHTHPTGMGPSGVPTSPMPSSDLSSNCKVGS